MASSKLTVLFICTGNSCRSPMGEQILKQMLAEKRMDNVAVYSAGIQAPVGMKAPIYSKMVCLQNGINLDEHRAKQLTRDMIKASDLILVMEKAHRLFIQSILPDASEKILLLNQLYSSGELEIADPIGHEMEAYQQCFNEIHRHLSLGLPFIQKRSQEK